jgi:hypothetical protein
VAGDDSAGAANAGARTATPPSTALLLAGAALTQLLGGGAALPLLTLTTAALALLPVADAHNWVTMPSSRASEASSVKPCRARLSAKPNVQINPGGEFFVEHTAGHQTGPSHAWTLVRVEDEDKLGLLTGSNIFSEYLSEANDPSSKPHAEGDYIAAAKYEKLHWSTMGANPGQGTGPSAYFRSFVVLETLPLCMLRSLLLSAHIFLLHLSQPTRRMNRGGASKCSRTMSVSSFGPTPLRATSKATRTDFATSRKAPARVRRAFRSQ